MAFVAARKCGILSRAKAVVFSSSEMEMRE